MTRIDTMNIGDTVVRVSGTGTPLVFVHGFTTTSEFWREQVEPFSSNHRVIRINLPGHGVSPRPEGRAYTIEAFADDVLKVYETLEIKDAVLIGLSMGGAIASISHWVIRSACGRWCWSIPRRMAWAKTSTWTTY